MDRREVMRSATGLAVASLLPGRTQAQDRALDIIGDAADLLGIKAKPLDLARIVAGILDLEKRADRQMLSRNSLLSVDTAAPLPAVADGSLYQAALPRLVSLIDRSETADPAIAGEAGEILADLNATQRTVPEALQPPKAPMSRARDYASLKPEYRGLFDSIAIRPERAEKIAWQADAVVAFKTRYEKVATDVKVPWFFIGLIHGLEASYNFMAHLHNGDYPLTSRTRQVPAGRPLVWMPPDDWGSSAKDALKLLGFTNQTDWSLERTLYRLEAYNGFGYRKQGVPTPYLWSFSTHYEAGKFVADGRWNAKAKSQQCGAAVLLKALIDRKEISV